MADALVEARYEYNWNSLVGCLQALLRQAGLPHDAARVSAVTGEAFRAPTVAAVGARAFAAGAESRPPAKSLADDLALLGLRARVDVWDLRGPRPTLLRPVLLRTRVGRRARGALARGMAVVASGVVRGEFGLLVGYDAARRAYRMQGPLSDETGDWLPADRLPAPDATGLALVIPQANVTPAAMPGLAGRAAQHAGRARRAEALAAWIAVLRSAEEIDASGHARAAQALAAAAGEAARFWRAASEAGVGEAGALLGPAQELAVALSRFATLFPFPMGGDVVGGGREAGARSLSAALALERSLQPLLAAPAALNPSG